MTAGLDDAARQRSEDWDRLMQVRDTVLKSLETARNEKLIGAPLEARVRLSADGDLYPLLEQYARELPALFIVSQVALGPRRTTLERPGGARRGPQVRALLEVHHRHRRRRPAFPTICGPCAEAVEEICHDRHIPR